MAIKHKKLMKTLIYFRWVWRIDSRGRSYYIDHNTSTTTRKRPIKETVRNYENWPMNPVALFSPERQNVEQKFLSQLVVVLWLNWI